MILICPALTHVKSLNLAARLIEELLLVVHTTVDNMKYLLLSFLLLTSCSLALEDNIPCPGEPIPGYKNAGQVIDGAGYDAEKTSRAMDIFKEIWFEEESAAFLEPTLDHLCVTWKAESWQIPGMEGPEGQPLFITGQTFNQRDIDVWIGFKTREGENKIGNSSLFHEIVHTLLWRKGFPSGDPDHEGDTYKGWTHQHNDLIKQMRLRALEEDL